MNVYANECVPMQITMLYSTCISFASAHIHCTWAHSLLRVWTYSLNFTRFRSPKFQSIQHQSSCTNLWQLYSILLSYELRWVQNWGRLMKRSNFYFVSGLGRGFVICTELQAFEKRDWFRLWSAREAPNNRLLANRKLLVHYAYPVLFQCDSF